VAQLQVLQAAAGLRACLGLGGSLGLGGGLCARRSEASDQVPNSPPAATK
jgi:hypothetical protein